MTSICNICHEKPADRIVTMIDGADLLFCKDCDKPMCEDCGIMEPSVKMRNYKILCNYCSHREEMLECERCRAPNADYEFTDVSGCTLLLCERCNDMERHRALICAFENEVLQCEDCKKARATDIFLHLSGRTQHLCAACFTSADHDD